MTQLSKAAQECRREYNRAYWERKAQTKAANAILEALPDVHHAEGSADSATYIAQLEQEVQSLTRRCGALSRQIRAYQQIIGDAIIAAQEKDYTVVRSASVEDELNNN